MKKIYTYSLIGILFILFSVFTAAAQSFQREMNLRSGGTVEIKNLYGRVDVKTHEENENTLTISAISNASMADGDIKNETTGGKIKIEVSPSDLSKRIDLTVTLPAYSQVKVETREGEVRLSGSMTQADVKTDTGTIAADIPLENVQYNFLWTASRPRFMSEKELEKVREISGGRFILRGKLEENTAGANQPKNSEEADGENSEPDKNAPKTTKTDKKNNRIRLNFTTARGIVLLNVNPTEVPTNLVERPLTEAARAIIRSGDTLLTEAILSLIHI